MSVRFRPPAPSAKPLTAMALGGNYRRCADPLPELSGWRHFVDESQPEGAARVEDLSRAEEPPGPGRPDSAGGVHGPSPARHDPQARPRVRKPRPVARD